MPLQSEAPQQGCWTPETEAEKKAIHEQLERILNSSLFKNSRRYPNLLRFVVERALDGTREHLKERTLGIEVFGREPDYDTNLDPVVRTTAVEIRKRIAQYYHEPSHDAEIRIDFPPGNYVPEFRLPQNVAVETAPVPVEAAEKSVAWKLPVLALAAALLIAGGAVWRANSPTPLQSFWAPVLESADPVLIGIGGYPTEVVNPVVTLTDLQKSERVAFADSTAMARVAALLSNSKTPYRVRFQASGKLDELKDGAWVLIGAFNNSWTLRLTGQLRFSFVHDADTNISRIVDRQKPDAITYAHKMDAPYTEVQEDYAIISRVWDPTTGKVVVTVAGLAKFGTAAAGEFLTTPSYMADLGKRLPKGWDRRNLQLVIAAPVIGHSSGTPRVVETFVW